jgi:hypothetical protein
VTDTTVEANVATGVWVKSGVGGSALVVELDRVRALNNTAGIGFETQGGNTRIRAAVTDSVAGGNGGAGLYALSMGSSSLVDVLVERTTAAVNRKGFEASGADAAISFSDSSITGNTIGLSSLSGGQLVSFGNNKIRGNTTDGAPTSTIAQQ